MRTHKQIIADAGGALNIARLFADQGATLEGFRKRVTAWASTDSIPAPYWQALVRHRVASFEELAEAASRRLSVSKSEAA